MTIYHTRDPQQASIQHPIASCKLMRYERLFVLMAALIPLASYNVHFILGWSVDRALFGLLILFFPFYFAKRKILWGVAPVLTFLGILALALSLMTGGVTKGVVKFLPSLIQSYIIFGIGVFVFKNNPRSMKMISFIFVSWAIIFILFSAYTLFFYYVIGITYVPSPFAREYQDLAHRMAMMHSRRLFLPLASAPHLGAMAGFIALWALIVFIKTRRWFILSLGILMLGIAILSLSRGPILSFVVAFSFLLATGIFLRVLKFNRQLCGVALTFLVIIVSITFYQGLQFETFGKADINRLEINSEKIEEILEGRHLSLRLHALEMYLGGDLSQLMFGQGLGAFSESGVGAYSFASYLTLLVETGFFGALIFTMIIGLPLLMCSKKLLPRNKQTRFWFLSIFSMALFIALVHLFYELKTLPGLWLQLSFVFALSQSRSKDLITAEEWFRSSRNSIRM